MDNEMRKMQQEAIHRVNEMQNRAKQHLREEPEPAPAEKPPLPAEEACSATTDINGSHDAGRGANLDFAVDAVVGERRL